MILWAIFFISCCYLFLFLLWVYLKDNSIVDIFWWFGFLLISIIWYYFSWREWHHLLGLLLVIIWSLRISSYILNKKIKSKREDPRYANWRTEWSPNWYFLLRSFFQIYVLQMVLLCIIAVPLFLLFQSSTNTLSTFTLCIAIFLSLSGFIIETISDIQLSAFVKTKKPWEIFTGWFYRYSRHPNYFWESLFWLWISILASQYSLISFVSFFTITFLLLFVSWIPLIENRYQWNKEWELYKQKTSVFIPWFPKK